MILMQWFKPEEKKPSQGKKVLCCDEGDFYIAQRFGNYWFSIPFYDSKFSRFEPPKLWCEIDFPEPYKGYVKICIDNELLSIDEIEEKHPEIHEKMVKMQLNLFKEKQKLRDL